MERPVKSTGLLVSSWSLYFTYNGQNGFNDFFKLGIFQNAGFDPQLTTLAASFCYSFGIY
jgi:hypothetical protein